MKFYIPPSLQDFNDEKAGHGIIKQQFERALGGDLLPLSHSEDWGQRHGRACPETQHHIWLVPCAPRTGEKPAETSLTSLEWVPERERKGTFLSWVSTGKNFYTHCVCVCVYPQSRLTLWSQWLQHSRLLGPWNFSGNNTGVGCHFFLQEILPTQGLNPGLLHLLYCRQILYYSASSQRERERLREQA